MRQVSITGLGGATHIDKTDGMARKREGPAPARITGETDRVYVGTRATRVVDDPVAGRRLVGAKEGWATTVIWNPWVAKARAMPDFGDDEWLLMLCIETASAADDAVSLAPGVRHTLRAVIRTTPR